MTNLNNQHTRPRSVIERVLGGSLIGVIVRLAILSFLVGLIMRILGLEPADVVGWFEGMVTAISTMSFNTLGEFGSIILLGGAIVLPIWLLLRAWRLLSGR